MFFGTDEIGFDVTSSRFAGEIRPFDRFSEPLEEIIEARIWAGLHYRTADVQARKLGRKVARYMAKHYFQPLDDHNHDGHHGHDHHGGHHGGGNDDDHGGRD